MKLRINLKQTLAAAALLSTAAFTVACSSATAGTASVGAAGTSSASSVPATTSSSSSSSQPSSSSSVADPSTEIDEPTVTVVVDGSALDATTAIWLDNSCTDVSTLLGALFAYPTLDDSATDDEYRTAYTTYYASLTDTLLEMTGRMGELDAPTIDGGQDLHDGYLAYLIGLADITGGGSVAIDAAAVRESIDAIIEQINFEIEQLGQSDHGLSDFQGEELQALMAQVPSCASLLNT
jgi:hypothetical protein